MIHFETNLHSASIKVLGIGGGGGNTVNCLHRKRIQGVGLYLLNTDQQALNASMIPNKMGLGKNLTKGLGAGANPEVGKNAALESEDAIHDLIRGTDLLFIAAGMGGGTGTGAAPQVARIAREAGILTVAVTTLPFAFEGKRRMNVALQGMEDLTEHVDTSIIIENQKVLPLISKSATVHESFETVDNILCKAVIAITDLITKPGLINLDFADLQTILKNGGSAFMVTGSATGPDRSEKAAAAAVESPLMKRCSLDGAGKIVINISGSSNMTLDEVNAAVSLVHKKAHEDCHIIMGAVIDEMLGDELRVTVIATEFNDDLAEEKPGRLHKILNIDPPEVLEKILSPKIPSTVMTQYESSSGRKFMMKESNLECPTFLRKKMLSKTDY